ncbi:MAG: ABC transporter permease [Clostridiales bacterium]|nr:ABC transporter permease [Clostridiales bacterium]
MSLQAATWKDFWQENAALFLRWWNRLRRQKIGILTSLAQPAIWLLLFGNLFSKMAQDTMPGTNYLTFMAAGTLIMTVFNGALNGGVEVLFDRETGFLLRLLVAPIHRLSLVISRSAFVLAVSSAQSLIILAVAYLAGVRVASGLGGVAMILLIGILFGSGLVSLSMALAFLIRQHGEFFTVLSFVSLPLLFLSTALAPLSVMPSWMKVLASLNPMTYAIDATRTLIMVGWDWGLVGQLVGILVLFDFLAGIVSLWVIERGLKV